MFCNGHEQPRAAAPQQRPRRDGRSWIWLMDADENEIIIKIVAFPKHFLRDARNVSLCEILVFSSDGRGDGSGQNANQVQ